MEEYHLYKKLEDYQSSSIYPFHMPGHKRMRAWFQQPFHYDITEIEGFDNLHHAEGILKESMERTASSYGADKSYYMVNGSTGGILSAISATCGKKRKILLARNCHKAAYNAVFLNGLEVEYIYPQCFPEFQTYGGILPCEIEKLLINNEDVGAVFITSPSYEGIVSDIKGIAEIVHQYGVPLIVDEAHGAHFRYSELFPDSALDLGADIVIQSLHKTLPSLTQTALLHVKGDFVDTHELEFYLSIYQTSSPSYLFMANIERCISYMEQESENQLRYYQKNLGDFREKLKTLEYVQLLDIDYLGKYGIFDIDKSKLVFHALKLGIKGTELTNTLLNCYSLQMEMSTSCYSLGISTLDDTVTGFERLFNALLEIDCGGLVKSNQLDIDWDKWQLIRPKQQDTIAMAVNSAKELIMLENASGRISSEFIYAYPPGIPIMAPGEVITNDIIEIIRNAKVDGISIQGLKDKNSEKVLVRKN